MKHFFRQHWNLQPLNLMGLALIAVLIGSYMLLSLSIAYDLPQADYWDWLRKKIHSWKKETMKTQDDIDAAVQRIVDELNLE